MDIPEVNLHNRKYSIDHLISGYKKSDTLQNINPKLYKRIDERKVMVDDSYDNIEDLFDSREIFDLIRNIKDPEHPHTLEELNVVQQRLVEVDNENNKIYITFTPTIPHCSMATLIGLSIRVQLLRTVPARFKVDVEITPGTHYSADAVNKQLADKERVAAALENSHLIEVINQCIGTNY